MLKVRRCAISLYSQTQNFLSIYYSSTYDKRRGKPDTSPPAFIRLPPILLLPRPNIQPHFCPPQHIRPRMQRPLIKPPRRIKILPKYRRPNRRFHLKSLHLRPIRIPAFQEITPFFTLWSRNVGEDGRATLTVGDK